MGTLRHKAALLMTRRPAPIPVGLAFAFYAISVKYAWKSLVFRHIRQKLQGIPRCSTHSTPMRDQLSEGVIAAAAQKVSIGGGGLAFFGGLAANEVAAIGGLVIGICGLVVQWYYKRRDDGRREELHKIRVRDRLLHPYEDDSEA